MGKLINNNLIVFESSPDFSDNSRGLWEYVAQHTSYETFWIVRDSSIINKLQQKNIPCALEGSTEAQDMIETAKFLVSSSFTFAYSKKKEQIHVSAWHGFGLKVVGFFESASATNDNMAALKIITTQSDIITSTSRLCRLVFSGMFALDPRKVKETGFPRNDIMLTSDAKSELKKITDINIDNSKLIFYLPTMRKGLKDEGAQFENNLFNYSDYNSEKLDSFLEEHNAYIFTKVHFADNSFFTKNDINPPKRVVFINTEILNANLLTIYHIMNAFDILVTDYSSVYTDFLLLNKPIIFSCPDIDKYQQDRGFIVDDPQTIMPGAIVRNQYEFLNTLKTIFNGNDDYSSVRKEKMSLFHNHLDSFSSKRLLKEMENAATFGAVDSSKDIIKDFLDESSPLFPYTRKECAEFFYDTGDGFNENSKESSIYSYNDEKDVITFEKDILASTKQIRFDPDKTGKNGVKNLVITIDGQPVMYDALNSQLINDYLVFDSNDPQIIFEIPNENSQKLKICFQCVDLTSSVGASLLSINQKANEYLERYSNSNLELEQIKQSRSWRFLLSLKKVYHLFVSAK